MIYFTYKQNILFIPIIAQCSTWSGDVLNNNHAGFNHRVVKILLAALQNVTDEINKLKGESRQKHEEVKKLLGEIAAKIERNYTAGRYKDNFLNNFAPRDFLAFTMVSQRRPWQTVDHVAIKLIANLLPY